MTNAKKEKISLDIFIQNKLSDNKAPLKEKEVYFKRLGGNIKIKQIDEFTLEESQAEKANDVVEVKKNNSKILKDSIVYPPIKDKSFQESLGCNDVFSTIDEIFTTFEIGELVTEILKFSDINGNFEEVDKGLES